MQAKDAELAELRGIVGALDAERDALQAELDRRAEAAAAEAGAIGSERQRAEEMQRCGGAHSASASLQCAVHGGKHWHNVGRSGLADVPLCWICIVHIARVDRHYSSPL